MSLPDPVAVTSGSDQVNLKSYVWDLLRTKSKL